MTKQTEAVRSEIFVLDIEAEIVQSIKRSALVNDFRAAVLNDAGDEVGNLTFCTGPDSSIPGWNWRLYRSTDGVFSNQVGLGFNSFDEVFEALTKATMNRNVALVISSERLDTSTADEEKTEVVRKGYFNFLADSYDHFSKGEQARELRHASGLISEAMGHIVHWSFTRSDAEDAITYDELIEKLITQSEESPRLYTMLQLGQYFDGLEVGIAEALANNTERVEIVLHAHAAPFVNLIIKPNQSDLNGCEVIFQVEDVNEFTINTISHDASFVAIKFGVDDETGEQYLSAIKDFCAQFWAHVELYVENNK